jgi:hypothetical protein
MAQPNLIASTADIAGQAKLPKDALRSTHTVRDVAGPYGSGVRRVQYRPPGDERKFPWK